MKLKILESSTKKVVAVTENNSQGVCTCPVTDFLHSQPRELSGSAKGFKNLFKRYANGGRQQLTAALFHEVNKEEGIWQFTKGRLRIFCYIDNDERLLVLSHGAIKKTQKVSKSELKHAISVKNKYLEAKEESNIILENIDEY